MDLTDLDVHGAFRRSDLINRFGADDVADAVARGDLRTLWRGVVVLPDRFLDPWTRAAGALMVGGSAAAITGPTAASLHGHDVIASDATHVILPAGRRARSRPDLIFHTGSHFASDVVSLRGIRVLSIARVTADQLCRGRESDALALADAVLREARDDHEIVRKRIAGRVTTRADPRGAARAGVLLGFATHASESPAESRFRLRLIDLGVPIPEVNWPLVGIDGAEIYRLDLAWPVARIVVEYDGYAAHVDRGSHDEGRADDLRRRGWIVIRATSDDMREPDRVVRELRIAFRDRGYWW